MNFKNSSVLTAAATCVVAFFASPVLAQGTFTPGTGTSSNCNVGTSGATVDTKVCTVGSVSATMTAWGYTGAALGTTQAAGFTQGRLADWDTSGFGAYTGVGEGASPHHAFDNITTGCTGTAGGATGSSVTLAAGCGGSIEGLLLNFGSSKVNLTNVGIGWNGGNADLSVWAWTGATGPNMLTQTAKGSTTTTGTTTAAMTGWSLVSNHDFGTTSGAQATGGASMFSSYYLITTYFGNATSTLTAGNDSFKLNSFTVGSICTGTVSGTACTVPPAAIPEPGSLALAGLALFGLTAVRRRNRKA